MSVEITVPPVGESISSVVIAKWLVEAGQSVKEGDTLVELETDKVNVEVPAPVSGKVTEILKKQGDSAGIKDILGKMEAGAAPAAKPAAAPAPAAAKTEPAKATARVEAPAKPAAAKDPMPAALRVLDEKNVPASEVKGTGKEGQVLKEDAVRHVAAPPAPSHSLPAGGDAARPEETVPMAPVRKVIAKRLVEAQQTAALLTTFNEVDMTEILALRKRYQDEFSKKHDTKLGFMSFFVKSAVEALKAFPAINAEIRGENIVYRNYYDIGVAVGGGKGLVVPVLRNAERMSFADVEKQIKDFGARAQAGKLKLEELQGGTFTVTNGGVYGSLLSTPIVNPPQSGVLGLHKIQERPVALDGQVVIRPMMYLALTYDHRLVDGREAVSFLVRIKDCIENPTRILLEL